MSSTARDLRLALVLSEAERLHDAEKPRAKALPLRQSGTRSAVRIPTGGVGSHVQNLNPELATASVAPAAATLSSGSRCNPLAERARILGAHLFHVALLDAAVSNGDLAIAWVCSVEVARERRVGMRPLDLGLVLLAMQRIPALRRPVLTELLCLFEETDR